MEGRTECWKAIAKIVVSLALLALLVRAAGVEPLRHAVADLPWSAWLSALGCLWLAYAVGCVRWWRWMHASGQAVSFAQAGSAYVSGTFFNVVLPTGVGGDLVRTWELARTGYDFGPTLASAIVDRVVGLVAAVVLAALCLWLFADALARYAMTAWLLLAFCAVLLALGYALYPTLEDKILARMARQTHAAAAAVRNMGAVFRACRRNFRLLTLTVTMSLLAHGLITLAYFQLAHAVGVDIPLGYLLLIVPLVFIAQTVPIALGGLGLREAALVVLLMDAGVARDAATALSLVFLGVLWLSVLPGGIWAMIKWLRKTKAKA